MKLNIQLTPPAHPNDEIVKQLTSMLPHAHNFFSRRDDKIYFSSCSNMDYHTLLIGLCIMFMASKPGVGFVGFGKDCPDDFVGYFCIHKPDEFLLFLRTLRPNQKQLGISEITIQVA